MKNVKKLKALIANEIESMDDMQDRRLILFAGFDAIKVIEGLDKTYKEIELSIDGLKSQETEAIKRAEKAVKEAQRIEDAYTERAGELDDLLARTTKDAQVSVNQMVDAARKEQDALKASVTKLNKNIKDKTAASVIAEARLSEADKELEEVRSRLRSI